MLRIGIIDDEKAEIKELSRYVKEYMAKREIGVKIDEYESGVRFDEISAMYDLIFLDIKMPKINGIDLGHEIRQKNRKLAIVYITSYPQHFSRAYSVHAYDYVEKPIKQKRINDLLYDFLLDMKDERRTIVLKLNDGTNCSVDISDICCFEYDDNRKIKVHMFNKKCINISATLKALKEKYSHCGFLSPHQSYLVNLARVEKLDIKNKRLILDNGMAVEVAGKKMKKFQTLLSEYCHKRLEDQ